ncbi:MAG: MFS transporter [Gammaproteobacteria bacterium]|nr:MFS transporter [Gammaproteobacteria bacterium]
MHTLKAWLPAFSGMTCLAFGAGLISIYGFFVEPLSREFGVGVATLNIGPVALLLVPGIVAPRVGRLVDRMSIRRLILMGATFAMVSLAVVSQAPSLRVAALAFLGFALGLTLYGPVVINGLMVKTYPGREARALAVAAMGISLATALLPPVVGALLAHLDWRGALLSVASALLLLLWLAVLVGIPGRASGVAAAGQHRLASGIYGQKAFWLIGLCVALGFNVSIVMAICYPPLFISKGYTVAEAGWFISMTGMAGLTGKAGIAWLGDAGRNHARWLAAGLLLLQAAGACLLLAASESAAVLTALCLLGLGGGAFIPMHPYLNSRYFDADNIGQVNGAQMPLFLPFGLIGAPLAGYAYDQSGNYDAVLVAVAVTLGAAALFALLLPAPE